jgi:hypothetical protein
MHTVATVAQWHYWLVHPTVFQSCRYAMRASVGDLRTCGGAQRLDEMACQSVQRSRPHALFEKVRFGIVLGSAGNDPEIPAADC